MRKQVEKGIMKKKKNIENILNFLVIRSVKLTKIESQRLSLTAPNAQ